MRYALIGCGRIAPNHIMAAQNNSLEIIAICDVIKDNMQTLLNTCNYQKQVKKYTDYKDMIEHEALDIVSIATESGKHAQIAIDCIKKGINVIIEKPIALSIDDSLEIIRMSKEFNVKVCVNHQNRFNKSIVKIREAVEEDRFGKLFYGTAHIRWNRNIDYYKHANWRGTWQQDGGALMNQCIHNIDLLRWMMGDEILEVKAFTSRLNHDYIEAEDLGLAIVKFKNGSYGLIEGTTDIFPKNLEETLYIFGEKGTVKAGGKSVNILEEWRFQDCSENIDAIKKKNSDYPDSVYGYGHTPLYADMIDAILTDREPLVNAEAGHRALELVLAIYKASATNETINFPLTKCSTEEFIGLFD